MEQGDPVGQDGVKLDGGAGACSDRDLWQWSKGKREETDRWVRGQARGDRHGGLQTWPWSRRGCRERELEDLATSSVRLWECRWTRRGHRPVLLVTGQKGLGMSQREEDTREASDSEEGSQCSGSDL